MAFRPPQEQEQGVPSLGYRLSSNRQPGIEQSNNRMPNQQQQGNPYEGRSFPTPEQYRRAKPAPMPMPDPRNYRNMPDPRDYMGMGRQSTDPRERYIANTQGGHPNMSQYGYSMQNRGPTTTDPIMTMLDDPQVMLDFNDARKLEEQMDPGNFFGNRMDIGEQFNVGPFGDIEALPMAYVPGDDYGSYIGDSVLGMDELGGQYDPMDEYEFDKGLFDFRIRTPGLDDIMPNYNRGGIASLRR
tara:strand:- start:1 stop:726 length:726 start_codon:yes stop_codon:yes gene_type:complete